MFSARQSSRPWSRACTSRAWRKNELSTHSRPDLERASGVEAYRWMRHPAAHCVNTTVSKLNASEQQTFVRIVGPVFEHSPWIAEATWAKRPFGGLEELHSMLCETVRRAGVEKQLALICAHPDLVG